MHISNNLPIPEEEENLLELINKGRTNIEKIKILTHYEFINDAKIRLHHISSKGRDFLKNSLHETDYQIFDGVIDNAGDLSNFKFRLKEKVSVLNEINSLRYTTADIPKELRGVFEIKNEYIYIIRFFDVNKYEITEEEAKASDALVMIDNDKYYEIERSYKKSIEKFWTEDPFKAIFKLKNLGFYLGINDPNKDENILLLKDYLEDEEIMMLSKNKIRIDNLDVNLAEIIKVKIPFKLTDCLRKEYRRRESYLKRQPNIKRLYGSNVNSDSEFKIDEIDDKINKIKLPRKPR